LSSTPSTPPSFAQRLKDPSPDKRIAALGEVLKPGGPTPTAQEVAPLLNDPDPNVRQVAVVVLGQIGAPAVSALASALDEKQPLVVRIFAASGLLRVGPPAAPAAEALGKSLSDADEGLRVNAALALSRIGAPALPVLRRALAGEKSAAAAARGLGWMAKDAAPAVDDLKRTAASGPANARISATAALVRITGDPGTGLPFLTTLIAAKDKPAPLRMEAIERVGEMQEKGRGASASLRTALDDADPGVRAAAALALARVGSLEADTNAALTRRLSDPDPNVQTYAAVALHGFGAAAKPALPALKQLAASGGMQVKSAAAAAVAAIEGPKPPPPAPKPAAPPGAYSRVAAKTAAEVAGRYGMAPDARALVKDGMTPRQAVEALAEKGRLEDAIRFLVHALPKPEAVWWAAQAAREAAGDKPPAPVAAAIAAAEKWAATQSEESRQAAQVADVTTPAGSAAIAAYLGGDNLGAPGSPATVAPPAACGDICATGIISAATSKEPEKSPERLKAALAKGIEVAAGTSRPK
jgi:HEAT repeat protein